MRISPFLNKKTGSTSCSPRSTNAGLYARFEKVKDGETKTVEHVDGISVVVGQIDGFPEAHERVNEALRLLSTIKITRRGAELLLANFELNERNRPLLGIETMGDVVAEMEKTRPRRRDGGSVTAPLDRRHGGGHEHRRHEADPPRETRCSRTAQTLGTRLGEAAGRATYGYALGSRGSTQETEEQALTLRGPERERNRRENPRCVRHGGIFPCVQEQPRDRHGHEAHCRRRGP
jgi:hypothetical protein